MSDNEKIKPLNHGKKWNEEELKQLLKELKKNKNIKDIAQIHGRTEGGIISRCKEVAYDMYSKKKNIDEIVKITKLDENTINEVIKQKNLMLEKKKKKQDKGDFEIIIKKNRDEINQLKDYVSKLEERINLLEKSR